MDHNIVDEKDLKIVDLWQESILEAQTKCLPESVVFAEKITEIENDRCCKIVCFLCNDGHKIESVGMRWRHVITSDSGYNHMEWCRAESLRLKVD